MGNNFRENLRTELNYHGVTIKELSAKTGIPVATLDCYLGARETIPSVDAAVKIAQALQVSVEYLVIGERENENKIQNKSCKEVLEILHWLQTLNSEQCKTILKLIKLFK